MRCSLILLSFALTILAAPVPVPQGQALAVEEREPLFRNKGTGDFGYPRDVEEQEVDLEARAVRGGNKRDAEAQPAVRGGNKRDAEAQPAVRGGNKRDAEAQPAVRGGNKRSNDISLRSVYNSAAGVVSRSFSSANAIIEAMKTRGFSSGTLLEPM